MPLQATSGAASYDAFGGGVPAVPNYIEDVFSCFLRLSDGTNTQAIVNNIDLSTKGGLVWSKPRVVAGENHIWVDSARGVNKYLSSDLTSAQGTMGTPYVFNTNGFTSANGNFWANGVSLVDWTFRKQPKFFDVVTFTKSSSPQTISHNLGSTPGCIFIKRTDSTGGWLVAHRGYTGGITAGYTLLNTTDAFTSNANAVTAADSTTFTLGSAVVSGDFVAYLFAHDAGGFGLTGTDNVISCGSYTGVGGGNVATITLGYEPQWILVKRTDNSAGGNWAIFDNMRGMSVNSTDNASMLNPNLSDAESVLSAFKPTATGFQTGDNFTASGGTYIYIAIRRGPMKVPTSGTSVFYPNAYSGTGTDTTITSTGFPPDLFFSKARSFSSAFLNVMVDRLRGASQFLVPSNIIGETVGTNVVLSLNMNGVTLGSSSNANSGTVTYAQWNFRRAPSCFDIVCYSGTGSTLTVDHNLQATPELIIIKRRNGDSSTGWVVYESNLGFNKYMILNQAGSDTLQYLTATSSTTFTLNSGGYTDTNSSGNTYVAYLFATCAGVSKVFSYTGNGSSQTINCGFTGGARFVLIKRTDVSSGNWFVWDTARGIVSGNDPYLSLNTTAVEVTSDDSIDTNSTGFVVNQVSATNVNVSSATYIGLAIA